MTEDGVVYLTKKKHDELKEKLAYLKGQKRDEIIRRIEISRGFGDLSENAEYDEARNEQRDNEADIIRLEAMLANVKLYDESDLSCDNVQLGNFVTVLCLWNNKSIDYQIVGSAEADPVNRKLSNASPVGSALIGKAVGDVVEVQVPAGVRQYKITDIRLPE